MGPYETGALYRLYKAELVVRKLKDLRLGLSCEDFGVEVWGLA